MRKTAILLICLFSVMMISATGMTGVEEIMEKGKLRILMTEENW